MSNNNNTINSSDRNTVDNRETSPSHGTQTVTSSSKSQQQQRASSGGRTNSFASAKVSHIQDEAGVTYRVVQIPSEFLQQATQVAVPATQLIATSQNLLNSDMVGGTSGQQVFLNTGNSGGSEVGKIAYIPTSTAVTVANSASATGTTQLQLQAVDGSGGQYYIMIPPGELVQTSGNASGQTRVNNNSTMVSATATPRLQQAAFIPLSKLDGSATASAVVSSTGQQITFGQPYHLENPPKEIKRRVSHNEVEKRRRDKINSWINKLARLVPSATDDASKQGQSKGGILAKTVDYINELRNTNVRLADQLQQMEQQQQLDGGAGGANVNGGVRLLRQQVLELTKENKLLKQRLAENGLPLPQQLSSSNNIVTSSPTASSSFQQLQPSLGQQASFQLTNTKRLIPVTVTSTGAVVLMSTQTSSDAAAAAMAAALRRPNDNSHADDDDDDDDLDEDDETVDRMES